MSEAYKKYSGLPLFLSPLLNTVSLQSSDWDACLGDCGSGETCRYDDVCTSDCPDCSWDHCSDCPSDSVVYTLSATIKFDANGGVGGPTSTTVSTTSTNKYAMVDYTLPLSVPTRTGYTFSGWDSGYAGVFYPGDTTEVAVTYTGDTVHEFTAIWTEQSGPSVYIDGDWRTTTPYVYYNNKWNSALAYVYYNNKWRSTE